MRAITVCVDYSDLLALTLPYNLHHFDEWWVVTSPQDQRTLNLMTEYVTRSGSLRDRLCVYITDAFYRNGASFNKWLALEEGLDKMGRIGWLCLIDPDVLWPKKLPHFERVPGYLYAPLRRMYMNMTSLYLNGIPPEERWTDYPLHRQQVEYAGFSQVFHADDPVLGKPPWHEVNWRHAGGADSFFQMKWPESNKIRPPFEVLHLGPAGINWAGRVMPYLDGKIDPKAKERIHCLSDMVSKRSHGPPSERFRHEKIPPQP